MKKKITEHEELVRKAAENPDERWDGWEEEARRLELIDEVGDAVVDGDGEVVFVDLEDDVADDIGVQAAIDEHLQSTGNGGFGVL